MKNKIDIRLVVLLIITFFLGLWRFFGIENGNFFWNFTPIGAMALFAGTYFHNTYKSYIFPLVTLFVSDIILMHVMYPEYRMGLLYDGWAWTYGSFIVMVLIARTTLKKVKISFFILGSFLGALAHYILTDFGVWIGGGLDLMTGKPYTQDWAGLLQCYIMGIPYFKNILIGNLFFGSILFGGFERAQHKFPQLRIALDRKHTT